jgi:SAM-dependent methyltransferase
MHWVLAELGRQIGATARRPSRMLDIAAQLLRCRGRWPRYVEDLYIRRAVGDRWTADRDARVQRRVYDSYADYRQHQASKLDHLDLANYDSWFREVLRDRLAKVEGVRGASALCLAARIGTEVKAFADVGAFAVGIDLNPGSANPYVLPGDFHALQFADGCLDLVYTNSLDHVYEAERVLAEVWRVLKPGARLVLEAQLGSQEGAEPEFYESFWWRTLDDLAHFVSQSGFVCQARRPIDRPFPGESMIFAKPAV